MEEIEFAALDPMSEPDDEPFWPLLDALLARSQFPGLQRITVVVMPHTLYNVEARLPLVCLRSPRILQFQITRDWVAYLDYMQSPRCDSTSPAYVGRSTTRGKRLY